MPKQIITLSEREIEALLRGEKIAIASKDPLSNQMRIEIQKEFTYSDVLTEFLKTTETTRSKIADYRPACEPYFPINIDCALLIWLSDNSRIIYISKNSSFNKNRV